MIDIQAAMTNRMGSLREAYADASEEWSGEADVVWRGDGYSITWHHYDSSEPFSAIEIPDPWVDARSECQP